MAALAVIRMDLWDLHHAAGRPGASSASAIGAVPTGQSWTDRGLLSASGRGLNRDGHGRFLASADQAPLVGEGGAAGAGERTIVLPRRCVDCLFIFPVVRILSFACTISWLELGSFGSKQACLVKATANFVGDAPLLFKKLDILAIYRSARLTCSARRH